MRELFDAYQEADYERLGGNNFGLDVPVPAGIVRASH